MNIKRGLDRIFLVLAVIAMVPGFIAGGNIYHELGKRKVPIESDLSKFSDKGKVVSTEKFMGVTRYRTLFPPTYQVVMMGIVSAILTLPIVLFGLRGVRSLLIWIIEGFRGTTREQ